MTSSFPAPRLRRLPRGLLAGIVVVLASACTHQQKRDDAEAMLREGRLEEGLALMEANSRQHPASATLRAGYLQSRANVVGRLLSDAESARQRREYPQARQLLERAARMDPGNVRLPAMLESLDTARAQARAIDEAQALLDRRQPAQAWRVVADALQAQPRHAELMTLQRRIEAEARQQQRKVVAAGLMESRPISIDFREASLRSVLDVVSRHSGINFVLDKDIRADIQVTVFLRSAKVEEAIDLIVSTHQLAKKVLDPRTILIYPNTQDKRAEHQEQVVRVFHLASAEAKGAAAFLRSMLKLREPHVDERANMIALRESPEVIELAERLIALYDAGEPEVLLELDVIELRRNRLTNLGIQFPSSITFSTISPGGSTGLTLGNIRELGRDNIGLSFGSVLVNLRREVGDFTTLANPRIRARNREKAKVLVGDRVPVITATTGTGGFVSDSVSYLEVGLKLEVEPTVYADDDVAIKIGLEVSSLAGQTRTTSGTVAYQIGTRNAATVLRLRDGETQLLAGLISNEDRSSSNRVPGLGDLPLAGRLFSSQLDEGNQTELVLAITPRILKNVRRPSASESELWIGTEASPRLRSYGGRWQGANPLGTQPQAAAASAAAGPDPSARQPGSGAAPASPNSAPSGMATGTVPATGSGMAPGSSGTSSGAAMGPVPGGPPSMSAPAASVGNTMPVPPSPQGMVVPFGTVPPAAANAPTSTMPAPSVALDAMATMRWSAPPEVKVGDTFDAVLELDASVGMRGVPVHLKFDPARVALVEVREGDYFRRDGAATSFASAAEAAAGVQRASILRNQGSVIGGKGKLLEVKLKALAPGPVNLSVVGFEPVMLGAQAPRATLPVVLRTLAK